MYHMFHVITFCGLDNNYNISYIYRLIARASLVVCFNPLEARVSEVSCINPLGLPYVSYVNILVVRLLTLWALDYHMFPMLTF